MDLILEELFLHRRYGRIVPTYFRYHCVQFLVLFLIILMYILQYKIKCPRNFLNTVYERNYSKDGRYLKFSFIIR